MKKFLQKIIRSESSPYKLALAVTLGTSTAVSPFWGIQTWILFPLSWALKISPAISITILYLINNPWTMLPIAAADYYVGNWFTKSVLGVDLIKYNPSWMGWVNNKIGFYLMKYLGISELSLWSFVIGGILLSIVVAAITYPIALMFFKRALRKRHAA